MVTGDGSAFHLTLGLESFVGAVSPPLSGSFVPASAVGVQPNLRTLVTTRGSVSGIASVSLNFTSLPTSGGFRDTNIIDSARQFTLLLMFVAPMNCTLTRKHNLQKVPSKPLAPDFYLLVGPECRFENGCDVTAAYSTANDASPSYGSTKFFSTDVHTLKYELTVPATLESLTDYVEVSIPAEAFVARHDNPDGSGGQVRN